jgi:hypothetical protein
MPTLLDDLNTLWKGNGDEALDAYARLRIFIEQHQPWYPPQPEGFGPWIEYDGKNGPRGNDVVAVLTEAERGNRKGWSSEQRPAYVYGPYWRKDSDPNCIVAYCVKQEDA